MKSTKQKVTSNINLIEKYYKNELAVLESETWKEFWGA